MAEQLLLHDCPSSLKEAVREYWQRKARRIERLLHPVPPDQQHLRLAVRWQNDRWDVRLVLILPTGTLVADVAAGAHEWRAAIDRAAHKLAGEIRRHKQRLRHEDVYRRKARARSPARPPSVRRERRRESRLVQRRPAATSS